MSSLQFSYTDSFYAAFSSCLPCFRPSDSSDGEHDPYSHPAFAHAIPPPRARPDELQGLLADPSDDADTLSLHTNPGERHRPLKPKRRRQPKHIRVFGFDLFGRPPAIQLPESDDERERHDPQASGAHEHRRPRTISGSTLDSDAAPLDVAAIQQLSVARTAAALARDEEERRAKEDRRRRRRERKELKRAAMARALDLHAHGDEQFEGFQGSGSALPALSPSLGSITGSGSVASSQEFGPFAQGQHAHPFDPEDALAMEAEADSADFGGDSYTSRPRSGGGKSSSGTRTASDARTSSTGSGTHIHAPHLAAPAPAQYNHQFLANASLEKKTKRRKSLSARSKASTSSQSATAPPMSPPPPEYSSAPRVVSASGSAALEFEGLSGDFAGPDSEGGHLTDINAGPRGDGVVVANKDSPMASFPTVGLRGIERKNSDMGVFLARRGNE